VPQSPLLLSGPVSLNLDPSGHASPSAIFAVLRDVGLLATLLRAARERAARRDASASGDGTDEAEMSKPQHGDSVTEPLLPASPAASTGCLPSMSTPNAAAGSATGGGSDLEEEDLHLVLALPLGRDGVALSAAQEQLIGLARALLRRPKCASPLAAPAVVTRPCRHPARRLFHLLFFRVPVRVLAIASGRPRWGSSNWVCRRHDPCAGCQHTRIAAQGPFGHCTVCMQGGRARRGRIIPVRHRGGRT
jgi:hypothetical protein